MRTNTRYHTTGSKPSGPTSGEEDAQHTAHRARMVVLHERHVGTYRLVEHARVETFVKESAIIAEDLIGMKQITS